MFAKAHQRAGNAVEIATVDGPTDGPGGDAYRTLVDCPVHPCGPGKSNYGFSPKLDAWLEANYQRFDGVIVNGVWQYHGVAVRRALATRRPYVVFAHGMLDPYFKDRYPLKHLKKLVYWLGQERRNLNQARAVCFTSEEEQRIAAVGFPLRRFRGVVIPYGTMGPSGDPEAMRQVFLSDWPGLAGLKYLLFLGRIHPKKACDVLLDAFAEAAGPEMRLVMAGPDETGWGSELRKQASRLGIEDRLTWTGMLRGEAKWGALYGSSAFILPSHQENFGIAVADAMACGVIPLISDKVNIAPEVMSDGAGLVGPDTVEGTKRLIINFQELSADQKRVMQNRALESYQSRYALKNSAEAVYRALGLA